MMVPSGEATEATVNALLPLLAAGDTVIDGGNSNYKDTQRRGRLLRRSAIELRRLRHQRRRVGA